MNKFLKKAESVLPSDALGRYETYNLSENPFPPNPFVNKDSEEKKHNGSIYEKGIRQEEYKHITENFLIPPLSEPSHLRLGFILDTSFIGRGNGKSAFLVNLHRDINKEFCLDISKGKNKCFSLYFSPEPSGRIKTFDKFVDALFDSIFSSNIIDAALASIRLSIIQSISSETLDELISTAETEKELIDRVNDQSFYTSNKIYYQEILKKLKTVKELNDLDQDFPLFKSFSFDNSRVVTQEDFKIYYNSLKKGNEQYKFIFSDLVYFFEAAGYNGAFILIDDFERIPDFQSATQKKDFLSQLRSVLFDGISRNSKIGFFNFIFALHAGVPRLIQEAWGLSGMEQRVPLDPKSSNKQIIKFEPMDPNHAKLLIKKYLNEFRITEEQVDSLMPFTEDAVTLIGQKAQLNASKILQLAHTILDGASIDKIDLIDEEFVKQYFGSASAERNEESDDISLGLSQMDSIDLKGKTDGK